MIRTIARFAAICLLSLFFFTGCGRLGFLKFWEREGREPAGSLSVEIPAPPDVIMPASPARVLPPPESSAGEKTEGEYKRAPATVIEPALKTGYFDFDSARLTEETKETLRQNAAWLIERPTVEVQLQGHCDERGTVEYNFNLGQRRAEAVKAFLVQQGVPPDRLHTISYGEERPAVPGHSEETWRLNRRVEFHAY
jgi:peptidoglycan-associated lipoprotein